MVKNRLFELRLTKKNAKIGYKATKKGLKPIFSWYQTYAFNMGRTMRIELTHVWFTARCVNHFTMSAKCKNNFMKNIRICQLLSCFFIIFLAFNKIGSSLRTTKVAILFILTPLNFSIATSIPNQYIPSNLIFSFSSQEVEI